MIEKVKITINGSEVEVTPEQAYQMLKAMLGKTDIVINPWYPACPSNPWVNPWGTVSYHTIW